MILYAPIINPKVPAFIGYGGTTANIDIHFSHNRAVSPQAITGFQILIWQYNDATKKTQITSSNTVYYNLDKGWVKFTLSELSQGFLQPGMYYKIQIAYIDADGVGPYSALGISRYIGEQNFIEYGVKSYDKTLQENWTNETNFNTIQYSGYYKNDQVPSEIVYQYRFILADENNKIIQDTQWQIPDNSAEISMPFVIEQDLQLYLNYNLNFQIQTINGLILSKNYTIIEALQLPSLYKGQIKTSQDGEAIDNGYVKIQLSGTNDTEGYYRLVRHCDNEIADKWDEIALFTLPIEVDLSKYYWKDFTVEHGNTYTYAIQQYSSNEPRAYSERLETEPITVSFEHMFLSDEERQLRIAFNPKVSSFKETILEQKTDTIGSQFPFFSRNGHVRYKELPISGLISYWMDNDEYFGLTLQDLQLPSIEASRDSTTLVPARRTNLDDINFKAERQFKLAVLEWLNNGKPKLFRSPAEGNYIIRLMNISLSPTDGLGRMLHTFSATGYEIAEYNSKNCIQNNVSLINNDYTDESLASDSFSNIVTDGKFVTFTMSADVTEGPKLYDCQALNLFYIWKLQATGTGMVTILYDDKSDYNYNLSDAYNQVILTNANNVIEIEVYPGVQLVCYGQISEE